MKISGKQIVVGLLLLVVGLIVGGAIASAMNGGVNLEAEQAADVAKINAVVEEYQTSLNEGDFERWMAVWAADGIRMPPDEPQSVGVEAIRETMAPAFELFDFEDFAVYLEGIEVLGDIAYLHGQYEFSMTPKEGGDTLHYTGKYLSIFEKQADGSWKAAIDCFNYNGPPE